MSYYIISQGRFSGLSMNPEKTSKITDSVALHCVGAYSGVKQKHTRATSKYSCSRCIYYVCVCMYTKKQRHKCLSPLAALSVLNKSV